MQSFACGAVKPLNELCLSDAVKLFVNVIECVWLRSYSENVAYELRSVIVSGSRLDSEFI